MHIPSASSPIRTISNRFLDPDLDSDSDTQPRVKPYYATESLDNPDSAFTPSPLCDSPQTLKLGLSIGTRYPREEDLRRRACGLRPPGAAVIRRWRNPNLCYEFDDRFPEAAKPAVRRALQTWSEPSIFSFRESSLPGRADIVIGMYRGDHGDGHPFDAGVGGVLAHAFYPEDGRLHFDGDQPWCYTLATDTSAPDTPIDTVDSTKTHTVIDDQVEREDESKSSSSSPRSLRPRDQIKPPKRFTE